MKSHRGLGLATLEGARVTLREARLHFHWLRSSSAGVYRSPGASDVVCGFKGSGGRTGRGDGCGGLGPRAGGRWRVPCRSPSRTPLGVGRLLWLSWFGLALVLAAVASGGLPGRALA